ncbi:hypothetical protein BTO06_08755 [Tenacibaculum sp. SZ-18]|uniref:hypothetical protein n=1 Tax=Tenacibaculum sp. SZ-18 TaxID=754423 RepID=UPI000C2D1F2D|nr:hypothetical protein [Tenacibaculum sp. SZ-18]AUC15221.1 hypothetical protein BTO06_08755 [Tenacibaculum sp. SZ-18]
MRLLFIALFFVLFQSCKSENSKERNFKLLERITSIENYDDEGFFSDVRCMTFNNNHLYFTDYGNSELYKYSKKNFKLDKVIGGYGDGPGEFRGIPYFFISDNQKLYLENDYKRSIEIFDEDNAYEKTKKLPGLYSNLRYGYRFFMHKNKFYSTHSSSLKPIFEFNLINDSVRVGGKPFKFEYEAQNRMRNNNHVFKFNKNIITVSDNMPIVRFYDFDFKLRKEVSLEHYPEVKKTMDYIRLKELETDDSSFYVLIQDAYLFSDKLYLLISSYEPYSNNKIIVFNVKEEGDLVYDKTFYLDQKSDYKSIASDNEILVAFNTETTFVDIFDLKI